MRYVMYGAGAIGGLVGAQLHRAGFDVLLIARGEQLRVLSERGLRVDTPGGSATLQIPVAAGPAEARLQDGDTVFLSMKTQDCGPALAQLEAAARDAGISVVCAQNGPESSRMALRLFPRVYSMVMFFMGSYLEPGVVQFGSDTISGILDVGRFPAGDDAVADRIAADLTTAGFSSRAHSDITRWQYAKLLAIIGNTAQAAAGRDGVRDISRLLVEEGAAVLTAAGLDWVREDEMRARREGVTLGGGSPLPGTSVWQSLARGAGSIESDYLDGEIAFLGRLHGVPTPAAATLQRIGRRMAAEGRPPASMTPDEVMAEIEAARGGD